LTPSLTAVEVPSRATTFRESIPFSPRLEVGFYASSVSLSQLSRNKGFLNHFLDEDFFFAGQRCAEGRATTSSSFQSSWLRKMLLRALAADHSELKLAVQDSAFNFFGVGDRECHGYKRVLFGKQANYLGRIYSPGMCSLRCEFLPVSYRGSPAFQDMRPSSFREGVAPADKGAHRLLWEKPFAPFGPGALLRPCSQG